MNKFSLYIVFFVSILFAGCGEDRTYELEEKTQHNKWILEKMKDVYLWGDTLAGYEPEWKESFSMPDDFLQKMIAKTGHKDSWSFIENDTIVADKHSYGYFNHYNSYGFDYVIMNDPTGMTTKQYLRVKTVYPNSPAFEAGLKRNDFISELDGFKITNNNMSKLQKGIEHKLTVRRLLVNGDELVMSDGKEVNLSNSRYVEDVAFPVHNVVQAGGIYIGYLMCTRLLPCAIEGVKYENETGTEYRDMLDNIMAELRAAEVSEIVLDMRNCNFGTLSMAQRLASYVVNPNHINSVFAKTEWNARNSQKNSSIPYDNSVKNLNLGRVFVLTSEKTQGAAEWMIHCLKGTMGEDKVIVVGRTTCGQNVMTEEVGYEFHIKFNPVVAYVGDCNGNHEYSSIEPDIQVDESTYADWFEYGDMHEILFATAIEHILN